MKKETRIWIEPKIKTLISLVKDLKYPLASVIFFEVMWFVKINELTLAEFETTEKEIWKSMEELRNRFLEEYKELNTALLVKKVSTVPAFFNDLQMSVSLYGYSGTTMYLFETIREKEDIGEEVWELISGLRLEAKNDALDGAPEYSFNA